ncbi:MAG: beta-Ala-His dipeptidase [Desulfobacterales bacterium]
MNYLKQNYLVSGFLALFTVSMLFVISPAGQTSAQESADSKKLQEILKIFEQISSIPRCSTKEKGIVKWLKQWAKRNGLKAQSDSKGNLVIKVPASKGFESAPTIVLQGHLDMVCEKTPDSKHNFSKDSINLIYDGEWLRAEKTTLGADNGIGIAICLALAEDKSVAHPFLEMLFTVQEEVGLKGAANIKSGFIKGKKFINVDSEGEGTLTIGAAGGTISLITLPTSTKKLPNQFKAYNLKVSGLLGGHSGIDIHKNRANAIKILARTLYEMNHSSPIRLISLKGGTRANAIPRESEALFAFDPIQLESAQGLIAELAQTIQNEYAPTGKSLSIALSQSDQKQMPKSAITHEDTENVIKLLVDLPYGLAEMSSEFEGNVEMSNNLGLAFFKKKTFTVLSFERSAVMKKLEGLHLKIQAAAAQAGAKAKIVDSFPAWEMNKDSQLFKRSQTVYRSRFGNEPQVQVVHGGLECNVIAKKIPTIDMIAIGPTIENAHSPDEKLFIPSVEKLWEFLVALLASYGK